MEKRSCLYCVNRGTREKKNCDICKVNNHELDNESIATTICDKFIYLDRNSKKQSE